MMSDRALNVVGSQTLRERAFIALQYMIPQHPLSRLVYHVTRSRAPVVKNALIKSFMNGFHPDMTEAARPDPSSYASFNDFFTRLLRPDARPVDPNRSTLVSPVDGTISQMGSLDGTQLLQAKGHVYSLEALLAPPEGADCPGAGQINWVQHFSGGSFATLYLAPFNYHRIHMPIGGTLRAAWYVPGKLFSVNAVTASAVPGLFARNERIVCLFENVNVSFALVLVGALFVGSMETVWHGEVTPRNPRNHTRLSLDRARSALQLAKGAEMGRFNMGSTVILILPPDTIDWLPGMQDGRAIRVGQPLARLRAHKTMDHD